MSKISSGNHDTFLTVIKNRSFRKLGRRFGSGIKWGEGSSLRHCRFGVLPLDAGRRCCSRLEEPQRRRRRGEHGGERGSPPLSCQPPGGTSGGGGREADRGTHQAGRRSVQGAGATNRSFGNRAPKMPTTRFSVRSAFRGVLASKVLGVGDRIRTVY